MGNWFVIFNFGRVNNGVYINVVSRDVDWGVSFVLFKVISCDVMV